jgi:hypothetical protein
MVGDFPKEFGKFEKHHSVPKISFIAQDSQISACQEEAINPSMQMFDGYHR